jgi:hypothetical protein
MNRRSQSRTETSFGSRHLLHVVSSVIEVHATDHQFKPDTVRDDTDV